MNAVIYADFESILVPYNNCKNETNKSINKHIACGYSINVVDNHSNRCKQTYYRGDNVASVFCKEIRAIAYKKINFVKSEMIELTLDEQKEYENATYCHICKKEFGDKKNIKKYVIMIITLVNIVLLLMIFVIYVILLKKIYLYCFITVVTMILT